MASFAEADPIGLPLPRGAFPRPPLERRLDQVSAGGVGLIVASAGSGKSVLLRQWINGRPEVRVALLGLISRHDDGVVLARGLVDAVRGAAPGFDASIVKLVKSGGAALGAPFMDSFLAELEAVADGLVVVLEDVHTLTKAALVDDLGAIVTALPPTSRAIVSTRRDLPWKRRRLRLDGRLVELRGADLAFNTDEARRLVAGVSGRDLSDDQIATLVARTDGWAAGLQLAAIALQSATDVAEFIESFAGSDRLIADYLLEEVIEQQDADVQQFLLRTSVLDELTAELCDAVTGAGNARAMLGQLTARSLFLIPLDRSGQRFRYHHLFAEVLASQLRSTDPAAAAEAHTTAAYWLIDRGRLEQAVPHLLAAGEHDRAFACITQVGHRLFERGEAATLVRWLAEIESSSPTAPAAVGINLLAAHITADQGPAAAETYWRVTRRADLTAGERATSDALYAILVYRDLPPDVALKTANDVIDAIPGLDQHDGVDFLGMGGLDSIQVMAEYAAAIARFLQGDLHDSADALERALSLPGMRYPVWHIYTLGSLALIRAWAGRDTEALQLAEAAIDAARALDLAAHPGVTHAHMAAALAHLDRLEPDNAAAHLTQSSLQNQRRTSSVVYFDFQRTLEARLAVLADSPTAALTILRAPAASAHQPTILVQANRDLHVRLLIGHGQLAEAAALLDNPDTPEPATARIDLALAAGNVADARTHLDHWDPPEHDLRSIVRHLLRTGAVADAEGDQRAAKDALRTAVARAEPEQLRWPFLEVPAALRILQRSPQHHSRLIDDALLRTAKTLDGTSRAQASLIEPLTERELAVLDYLPGRLKNQEIAAELYVSVNTLKSHLRNIYRKLEVADRDEAVAKATDMGLL
jgi:LuxR family maltose regulon positive regulatory protein